MSSEAASPVLSLDNLTVAYRIGDEWLDAISSVNLKIEAHEIHGLVGESGSGKSTLGMAALQYLPSNARISDGNVWFKGTDLAAARPETLQGIWGRQIALVPQNPLDSLNPSMTIAAQMAELTRRHLDLDRAEVQQHAIDMLEAVRIADPPRILRAYPHQLSGGMQQRVMIAMALSTRPELLILDEPTTALDVTTQAVILDLVRDLIHAEGAAALYISHNLGAVAQLCDRVTVLYAGEVMETASVDTLFTRPLHPYTTGLLASLPYRGIRAGANRLATIDKIAPSLADRSSACVFADRCPVAIDRCRAEKPALEAVPGGQSVRCLRWQEIASGAIHPRQTPPVLADDSPPNRRLVLEARGLHKRFGRRSWLARLLGRPERGVIALNDVGINVRQWSTMGLVGESGSGKTTLARVIAGLEAADTGQIELLGNPIALSLNDRSTEALRPLQMVFQNPNEALNPYRNVEQTLMRTLRVLESEKRSRAERQEQAQRLIEAVGLPPDALARYPTQLSGGEKQRVAIARALAASPALVIADEPTSSLDVSVQATILNLLKDLRAKEGVSYLFISHDLDVIAFLADWIAVMYLGEIVEEGSNRSIYSRPVHPYTEALIASVPKPDTRQSSAPIRLEGDIPSPDTRLTGCIFHTRCPRKIGAICEDEVPPWRSDAADHRIRCHIPLDELTELQATAL
jgi:peptide/nickel transport system ATP-binding protein